MVNTFITSFDPIQDFNTLSFNTNSESDTFFQLHNPKLKKIIFDEFLYYVNPSDTLLEYEYFLNKLITIDQKKFNRMHKGSPFFMMAWISLIIEDYSKALFYLNQSVAEDRSNAITNWQTLPAHKFLCLSETNHLATIESKKIQRLIQNQLLRFHQITGVNIEYSNLINYFEKILYKNKSTASIISAFYIFLLEHDSLKKQLVIKGKNKGSIHGILLHFNFGGSIFESFLRIKYRQKKFTNIGNIYSSNKFKIDFGEIDIKKFTNFADDKIYNIFKVENDDQYPKKETTFFVVKELRNFSSHSLVRNDVFINSRSIKKFDNLFEYEINAIFFILDKLIDDDKKRKKRNKVGNLN